MDQNIFLGGGGNDYSQPQSLTLKYANRHGMIAGATGTGKTVTLQILAEGFSQAGAQVWVADVDAPALADCPHRAVTMRRDRWKRALCVVCRRRVACRGP